MPIGIEVVALTTASGGGLRTISTTLLLLLLVLVNTLSSGRPLDVEEDGMNEDVTPDDGDDIAGDEEGTVLAKFSSKPQSQCKPPIPPVPDDDALGKLWSAKGEAAIGGKALN